MSINNEVLKANQCLLILRKKSGRRELAHSPIGIKIALIQPGRGRKWSRTWGVLLSQLQWTPNSITCNGSHSLLLFLLLDETWPLLQKPPLLDNSERDGKISKEILDFLPPKAIGGSRDSCKIKRCDPIYTPSYKACHTSHTWLCNQKCPKIH